MIFRRSIFVLFLGMIVVSAFFGLRQRSDFAAGYAQGFAAAQQTEAAAPSPGEAGETAANAAGPAGTRYPVYGRGWGFFPIFGVLGVFGFFLKFWLILLFFGFLLSMFGRGRFHRWGGSHHHDAKSPRYEKRPEDVEPKVDYV